MLRLTPPLAPLQLCIWRFTNLTIITRDSINAIARRPICVIHPSVTRADHTKTV